VTRVLIADDHAVVRRGLAVLIAEQSDLELVGEAGDGRAAVELVLEQSPDVVLIDLSMPVLDGIDATREILAARPLTRVAILTSFAEPVRIRAALAAGALGYLLKDSEPEDLISGIRLVAAGHSPLAAEATRALAFGHVTANATGRLTAREGAVLGLVAKGCSNKEIARRLEISEKTVKAHLTSVFRSIGVFDRLHAALWARDHGFGAAPLN
jgi:DNA-binding NarL/FixJ family response regulator